MKEVMKIAIVLNLFLAFISLLLGDWSMLVLNLICCWLCYTGHQQNQ